MSSQQNMMELIAINENVKQYYEYFTFNDKNGFICKYKHCEQFELFEDLMISHVSDHLIRDRFGVNNSEANDGSHCQQLSTKTNESIDRNRDLIEENASQMIVKRRRSDRIAEKEEKEVYVCEWKDCHKSFTYLRAFEGHNSQHLAQEIIENDSKSIEFKPKTMSRHINEVHLSPNCSNYEEYSYGESSSQQFVRQKKSHFNSSLNYSNVLTKPKTSSAEGFVSFNSQMSPNLLKFIEIPNSSQNFPQLLVQNIKTEPTDSFEIETLHNQNVNVSISENNTLLSCKGLASASKVAQFFDKKVIDGKKYYFCKFNQKCQFKTHLSQKIAEHINIIHIGCEFKCHKANCNKVFKTPHTWRQHQKNHICGFGIYGYGKNVIGVCKMDNINKHNKRIIIDGKRSFQCTFNGCNAILTHRSGIKRHIHNQHICPYRVNLHVIRNRNLKSDQTLNEDNSEINSNQLLCNNKIFECKRFGCKAKFSVYSDLLKHENVLCKYRKVTKNNNSMQKIINKQNNVKLVRDVEYKNSTNNEIEDKSENMIMKSFEVNDRTLNGNKKQTNKESTISIVSEFTPESNVSEYYSSKSIKGVTYHLCQWKDCKFTTKFLNKIIEHIENQHMTLEGHSRSSASNSSSSMNDWKRKRSPNMSQPNKTQYLNSNEINQTQVEEWFKSKMISENETKRDDNLNDFIDRKRIDGEPNYFCKWFDCKYYTNAYNEITNHLKERHIGFGCDIDNCQKSFRDLYHLQIHQRNHICGFGIEGRKPVGICDLDNIRKYRNEKIVNKQFIYSCKWSDCRFVNESRSIALSHIHNQHICPNRLKILPTIGSKGISTAGQSSKIISLTPVSNQIVMNQNEYTCKRRECGAKYEKYSDLLKHEELFCNYNQTNE